MNDRLLRVLTALGAVAALATRRWRIAQGLLAASSLVPYSSRPRRPNGLESEPVEV